MISKEVVLKLHELLIIKYGGSNGIRDEGLMESAISDLIKLLAKRIYIQQD